MNINKILANNIKHYRSINNLTQEKLAELCGLHRTYISSIELGKRTPTLKTIEIIANVLNIKFF